MVHKSEEIAKDWLEKNGFKVLNLKGAPDFMCRDKDNKICFVEVKSNNDFLREHQRNWIKVIEKETGIKTYVVNVDFIASFKSLKERGVHERIGHRISFMTAKQKIELENQIRKLADREEFFTAGEKYIVGEKHYKKPIKKSAI